MLVEPVLQLSSDTYQTDVRATLFTLAAPVPITHKLDARSASSFAVKQLVEFPLPHEGLSEAEKRDDGRDETQLLFRALAPIDSVATNAATEISRGMHGIVGNIVEFAPMDSSSRSVLGSTTAESSQATVQGLGSKVKRKWIPLAGLTEEKREHVRERAKRANQRYEAKMKASDPAVKARFRERKRLNEANFLKVSSRTPRNVQSIWRTSASLGASTIVSCSRRLPLKRTKRLFKCPYSSRPRRWSPFL